MEIPTAKTQVKLRQLIHQDMCACGCGSTIGPHDASPDFKYIQCQLLWIASVDQADPAWWRANQRYLFRLVALESRWSECYWEYEVTERHVILYGVLSGDYEGGLAVLIQRYVQHFRTEAPEWDIDVAMSQA